MPLVSSWRPGCNSHIKETGIRLVSLRILSLLMVFRTDFWHLQPSICRLRSSSLCVGGLVPTGMTYLLGVKNLELLPQIGLFVGFLNSKFPTSTKTSLKWESPPFALPPRVAAVLYELCNNYREGGIQNEYNTA